MRSSNLKRIRVAVAVSVLILFFALFTDIYHHFTPSLTNTITWIQFVPSANKFISAGIITAFGFLVVLLLTFLTGRTYCSFLCPLGIFQDAVSRVGGRIRKRFRRYGYGKPFNVLRYSILGLTAGILLFSGIWILSLLDPYSIFGRTITMFAKPAVAAANNMIANVLGEYNIYTFVHTKLTSFRPETYIIPGVFLAGILVMSLIKGRLFCNTVCPVGTLLGLISKISLFRIRFDSGSCTRCGRCAVSCKSSCIDFLSESVDVSRCVGCFNCIKACPDKAMEFSMPKRNAVRNVQTETDASANGRRNVLAVLLAVAAGTRLNAASQEIKVPVPKKASTVKENRTRHVCPPGATSVKNFNSNCTACSLCITACPNGVLVPSFKEYGLSGIMQPVMDYHKGFCAYECVVCPEVCPSGALLPLTKEAKKLTQIGKAVFIEDNCIVKTEKTACGACAESCPTKAVHMIPYQGSLTIPETKDSICIGCGHCENACPTVPYKAIFINGNSLHVAADKPDSTRSQFTKPEEFPF